MNVSGPAAGSARGAAMVKTFPCSAVGGGKTCRRPSNVLGPGGAPLVSRSHSGIVPGIAHIVLVCIWLVDARTLIRRACDRTAGRIRGIRRRAFTAADHRSGGTADAYSAAVITAVLV